MNPPAYAGGFFYPSSRALNFVKHIKDEITGGIFTGQGKIRDRFSKNKGK